MKCFYHNGDLDGRCSAAIVKKAHPSCEMIGINYGWKFPWESIEPGETVFMVDFSLEPLDQMLRLHGLAKLIWIEHHSETLKWIQEGNCAWEGIQRDGIGACQLCWEYLFGKQPVPRAVRLLALHDVWDHSDPETMPFQYGMRNHSNDPEDGIWKIVLDGSNSIEGLVREGRLILRYIERDYKIRARVLSFETEFEGLRLLAANFGPGNSTFFDSVWDPTKYDAMCLFYWKPKQQIWNISLYRPPELPEIDLGAIAKQYGGGGHKGAAGFQHPMVPFNMDPVR